METGTGGEGARHGGRLVLYCRVPGLLAQSARQGDASPLAVADGRLVCDACPAARRKGVHEAQAVAQARRLCPTLRVVPLETLKLQALTERFLDHLTVFSSVIEPEGPAVACADLTGAAYALGPLSLSLQSLTGLPPVLGLGACRLAARACAECALPPERLPAADVRWLWPEDERVTGRLRRLGLDTFGHVAALREEDLFYQFGKIGRLLHRRACGQDFAPLRALYPPPRAEERLNFDEHPLSDRARLQAALATLADQVGLALRDTAQVGRRVVLGVATERETHRGEWVVPHPIQDGPQINRAAQRLLMQMPLAGSIVSLHLIVDELETPTAATADLFAGRLLRDTRALESARRMLEDRYGRPVLTRLSQRPLSASARRQALESEWRGAPL